VKKIHEKYDAACSSNAGFDNSGKDLSECLASIGVVGSKKTEAYVATENGDDIDWEKGTG
jgi:hypothetical protein